LVRLHARQEGAAVEFCGNRAKMRHNRGERGRTRYDEADLGAQFAADAL
jgi:hypothetical protein